MPRTQYRDVDVDATTRAIGNVELSVSFDSKGFEHGRHSSPRELLRRLVQLRQDQGSRDACHHDFIHAIICNLWTGMTCA